MLHSEFRFWLLVLLQDLLCCGRDFSLHGLYIAMEPIIAAEATTKAWRERAHWFGVHTSCEDNAVQQPSNGLNEEGELSSDDDSDSDAGASGLSGRQRAAHRTAKAKASWHAPVDFTSPFQVKGEALASAWLVQAQGEVRHRNPQAAA